MTLDLSSILTQLPLVGLMLWVVLWFVNRSDRRDEKWWKRQDVRDAAFLAALTDMRDSVRDLKSALREREGGR